MASGIVNDFLQDSLAHLEAQSSRLLDKLAQLHAPDTPGISFLSEGYGDNVAHKLDLVQQSFAQIEEIVLDLKCGAAQGLSSKLNNKLLSLNKIQKVLKPLSQGSVAEELSAQATSPMDQQQLEVVYELEFMISEYALLALYQISLTQVLQSSLPLSEDLLYWEVTSSSSWRVLLYSLQTLPLRLQSLVTKVWQETMSAAKPDVQSLDIAVPQYIAQNHPTYQGTYKLFIHYKRLLINSLYNNILANNVKGFYKLIGTKPSLSVAKHPKSSIKQYISVMLGTPFSSITEELHQKRDEVRDLQAQNAKQLGALLSKVPNYKDVEYDKQKIQESLAFLQETLTGEPQISSNVFNSLYTTSAQLIPQIKSTLQQQTKTAKKPNFLIRYWPTILTTLLYGPSTVITIVTNKDLILEFIQKNLVETVQGFVKNWIFKPVTNILSTIRHDDNSEISIMSQKSLDSDLESLKRMVIDYTLETSPEYAQLSDPETLRLELDKMVSTGDMTPMMKGYEQDIKQPLRNLISGRLPRALLIQIQKTKVDGAVAISGIDKLLKSQELVFGIVAASPALIVLGYCTSLAQAYVQRGYVRGSAENRLVVSKNLNNVERLLGELDDSPESELDYVNGMLLFEIVSLRSAGLRLIPSNRRMEWIRDVSDLVNSKSSTKRRLNTVARIYHVYSQFL